MLLEALQWGTAAALIALVYAVVLPSENTPMGTWYDLLQWMEGKGRWAWLAKPLGACEKCFAGQLALWSSWCWLQWDLNAPVMCFVLLSAASAILIVSVLTKLYQWTQN